MLSSLPSKGGVLASQAHQHIYVTAKLLVLNLMIIFMVFSGLKKADLFISQITAPCNKTEVMSCVSYSPAPHKGLHMTYCVTHKPHVASGNKELWSGHQHHPTLSAIGMQRGSCSRLLLHFSIQIRAVFWKVHVYP